LVQNNGRNYLAIKKPYFPGEFSLKNSLYKQERKKPVNKHKVLKLSKKAY
jgi:hypothetical protein